jgi:TolB-like protein/Tfp pilus assembly protein PilF/predicted Ser/Thr protein kinase
MAETPRQRLKRLFAAALELEPEQRSRFLDEHCHDAAARAELERLLAAASATDDFLEQPPTVGANTLLARLASARIEPFAPHQRLGPYEILEPLGAGGMGHVYRARDVRLDRIVALKVLTPSAARDEAARRRFDQEARVIAKLNHPNICALYDVGYDEGVDFLVMEYLEGETLAARLERGALPADALLRCALELADGLDRAHRAGVIHRDLKPSNIVLCESGAKLLDFGIARLLDQDADATAEAPFGTAAYMSPEQLRGERIDERSDLYSFGAVLYEMSTGRRAAGAPPLGHTEPEGLAAIVNKALEPDRERRYQRASEMRTDLQNLQHAARGAIDRRWRRFAAVAVLCLTGGAAGVGYFVAHSRSDTGTAASSRRSVAVLPFKPLAGKASEDIVLGLGLSEALIAELGAFKTIAVRPISESSRYGPERDPLAAGRELGTDLVVDGAIQRAEGRLRVNVSLVRVSDGVAVWTDRFDTTWTDVFRVQDAIAEQVGRALSAVLSNEGRLSVSRRRTEDAAAYEAYLKGRYFWNMRTSDGLQKALGYFQQAIDRDNTYARAYAGLADTYAMLGSMPYAAMPAVEAGAKAKAAARQALALDETLAEAHVSLAFVTYAFDWDWPQGEREFKRAIELDPAYATAHIWYALYLGQLGRVDEAVAAAERARELEPLSLVGTYLVGLSHYFARRFDAAAEYAQKTLEINPKFPSGRRLLGQVYAAERRYDEALIELQRLNADASDNWLHLGLLAHAYGRTGDRAKAQAILDGMVRASKRQFVPAAQIAIGYAGLGDRDAAFLWLERAYSERSQALNFLKMDPLFDSLRSDPRYADLTRRIGLTP